MATKKPIEIGCSFCRKIIDDKKRCGRCRVVCYCSKECQRNDWGSHKTYCVEYVSEEDYKSMKEKGTLTKEHLKNVEVSKEDKDAIRNFMTQNLDDISTAYLVWLSLRPKNSNENDPAQRVAIRLTDVEPKAVIIPLTSLRFENDIKTALSSNVEDFIPVSIIYKRKEYFTIVSNDSLLSKQRVVIV